MAEYSTVYKYVFLVCSSVDGHMCSSQDLGIYYKLHCYEHSIPCVPVICQFFSWENLQQGQMEFLFMPSLTTALFFCSVTSSCCLLMKPARPGPHKRGLSSPGPHPFSTGGRCYAAQVTAKAPAAAPPLQPPALCGASRDSPPPAPLPTLNLLAGF